MDSGMLSLKFFSIETKGFSWLQVLFIRSAALLLAGMVDL